VNRPLSGPALSCNNAGGGSDGSGFYPGPINDSPTTQDYGPPITLQNTENPPGQDNSDTGPACAGYVAVVGTANTLNPSNLGDMTALSPSLVVTMQSAALVRNARMSTHAWLQSDLDGKNKKATDDGATRTAPKL